MENASKALVMAGSTLIAVMIFAVFVLFMKNISTWPESEGELLTTEQRARFNEEYQVYYKSAMYGVDVVSCLNKALSYNEKYVVGGSSLSGDSLLDVENLATLISKLDQQEKEYYCIDVRIKINSEIEESIEVTALDPTSNKNYNVLGKENEYLREFKNGPKVTFEEAGFKITDEHLSTWNKDTELKYKMFSTYNSLEPNIQYSLLGNGSEALIQLLKHSSDAKQIVKNKGENKLVTENGWTTATWTTYLYNFKQKRFTCKDIQINADTGLVNMIVFEEIDI